MADLNEKRLVNAGALQQVAQGVLNAAAAKDTAVEERLQGKINTVSASVTILDGKVDTAVETLENADSQLQTAINNEKTRAEGEEAKLSKAIADETTRAEGAEKDLRDRILAVETNIGDLVGSQVEAKLTDLTDRMTAAEGDIDDLEGRMDTAEGKVTALQTSMGTAQGDISTLKTGLAEEITRAKAAEGKNAQAIADEVARATKVEGEINTTIAGINAKDQEQDVAIKAAKDAADKAQGEVDALESTVETLDTRLTNAVSAEESRAKAAEEANAAAIAQEVTDRKNAISGVEGQVAQAKTDLQGLIDEKIQQVNGANEALEGRVAANEGHITTLMGGEEVEGSVANALKVAKAHTDAREAVIKKYADDAVSVEQQRAIAKEEELNGSIGTLRLSLDDTDSALAEEVQRAEGQEAAIRQELANAIGVKAAEGQEATGLRKEIADAVAAEETRAKGVEQAIRGEVTAAIAQEVTDRNAAIKVEADRAKAEEADIRADFAAADATLGGRIDGVVGRLDVIEGEGDGSIAKAQAAAEAKAQELVTGLANGQVATNKANIETLMGGEEVDGSVAKQIKDAIDEVNGAAESLEGRVAANEGKLAVVQGTGEGSIKKAQADAQAYADQQIAALVNSAPEAMNTLKELADAIDANKEIYDTYIGEHATAMANMKKELQDEIDADVKVEKERAEGQEAAIRGEFAAADTALHTTISAEIDADVKAEADRAKGVEAAIRQELAEEKAALQKEIDDDVAAEALIRKNADDALAGRLDVLEGEGEGSIRAAVQAVADDLAEQMDPAVEGSLAKQIADEKTRAQNAEKANADGLVDLRSDVVKTFQALKLSFNEVNGTAQIALVQDGQMDGEVSMPIGTAVEIPVMDEDDVNAIINGLL